MRGTRRKLERLLAMLNCNSSGSTLNGVPPNGRSVLKLASDRCGGRPGTKPAVILAPLRNYDQVGTLHRLLVIDIISMDGMRYMILYLRCISGG